MRLGAGLKDKAGAGMEIPGLPIQAHQPDPIHHIPKQMILQRSCPPFPAWLTMPVGWARIEPHFKGRRECAGIVHRIWAYCVASVRGLSDPRFDALCAKSPRDRIVRL